jgi:hypothetical protein
MYSLFFKNLKISKQHKYLFHDGNMEKIGCRKSLRQLIFTFQINKILLKLF